MHKNGSKFKGRGGHRGGATVFKRSYALDQLPPSRRPTSITSNRGCDDVECTDPWAPILEETLSLVTERKPSTFAIFVKLVPDLVDDVQKLEDGGGTARIKFDSAAGNLTGNVIDIAGKEFRFTWSNESGDLCDIYEQQSCKNDNELLIESGHVGRKVNVQRILDETTKKHVKMRSEEAERKLKSRKAIVLDHGDPSVHSKFKPLAAGNAISWKKHLRQNKEPSVKRWITESPPALFSNTGFKSGSTGRSMLSCSSPLGNSHAASPPVATESIERHKTTDDMMQIVQNSSVSGAGSSKLVATYAVTESAVTFEDKSLELERKLFSLLLDNPKGMSLKSLEKAFADSSVSIKLIEPIIKKIAVFQAPGRYVLKPNVESQCLTNTSNESSWCQQVDDQPGPGCIPDRTLTDQISSAHIIGLSGKDSRLRSDSGEEINQIDNLSFQQQLPETTSKSNPIYAQGSGCSGECGSSSDSDNSSHGSDRSRSAIHSPAATDSSSDSESGTSVNSKEEDSDEEVDIMASDDDKDPQFEMQSAKQSLSSTSHSRGPMHGSLSKHAPVILCSEDGTNHEESGSIDIEGCDSDTACTEVMIPGGKATDVPHGLMPSCHDASRGGVHFDDEHPTWAHYGIKNVSSPDVLRKHNPKRDSNNWQCDKKFENVKRLRADVPQTHAGLNNTSSQDMVSDKNAHLNSAAAPGKTDSRVEQNTWARVSNATSWPPNHKCSNYGHDVFTESYFTHDNTYSGRAQSFSENEESVVDVNCTIESRLRKSEDLQKSNNVANISSSCMQSPGIEIPNLEYRAFQHLPSQDIVKNEVERSQPSEHRTASGSHGNRPGESLFAKFRQAETRDEQENHLRLLEESCKKSSVSPPEFDSLKHRQLKQFQSGNKSDEVTTTSNVKEKRERKTSAEVDLNLQRELFSDEDCSSFLKYEKDAPDVIHPIKDFSQYKKYTHEYREKYDCYHSLIRITLKESNEFSKFGKDIEYTAGRDMCMYKKMMNHLLESYHKFGERHKRMKKTLIVIHKELESLKQRIIEYVFSNPVD